MCVKFDPELQKEVKKVSTIITIIMIALTIIGFFIGDIILSLPYSQLFLFVFGFVALGLIPSFILMAIKYKKYFSKLSAEEREQINVELNKYQKEVAIFKILSVIPLLIGFILFFIIFDPGFPTIIKMLPIIIGLFGVTATCCIK